MLGLCVPAVLLGVGVFLARPADAQTAAAPGWAVERGDGFVGVGFARAADDAAERMRFPHESARRVWLVEGAVWVARRVALGGEFSRSDSIAGGTSGRSFSLADEQQERQILAVVRARPLQARRIALDLVAGAGVLLQDRETRFVACGITCAETVTNEDRSSPALAVGADVPIAVAPHVAVAALVRVYFLRRGEFESFNVARRPSARPAMGVSGRVGW